MDGNHYCPSLQDAMAGRICHALSNNKYRCEVKSHLSQYLQPVWIINFCLSMLTTLIGVTEKMYFITFFFSEPKRGLYQRLEAEGVMMKLTAQLLTLFGKMVIFLTTNIKYKRMSLPEEVAIDKGYIRPAQGKYTVITEYLRFGRSFLAADFGIQFCKLVEIYKSN